MTKTTSSLIVSELSLFFLQNFLNKGKNRINYCSYYQCYNLRMQFLLYNIVFICFCLSRILMNLFLHIFFFFFSLQHKFNKNILFYKKVYKDVGTYFTENILLFTYTQKRLMNKIYCINLFKKIIYFTKVITYFIILVLFNYFKF